MRRSVFAVLALMAALTITVSTSVSHAESPTCSSPGYICVWSGIGYVVDSSGAWLQDFSDNTNWPGAGGFLDGGIENNDSSVRNSSTGQRVRVFKFQGWGTQIYCVPKGTAFNLAATGRPADQGSSHLWNTGVC